MTSVPRIARTASGRAYLHIWRTGRSYERQKGAIYRREWTNVLFSMEPQPAAETAVHYHDVRNGLPFPDAAFEAAYALHILEHLTPAEATSLVDELYRVLKPAGIVRISTPDLEDMCRSYLRQLDECRANRSGENLVRYRWAVLELLDQLVREQSGGLMAEAAARGDFEPEFAKVRFGDVFDEFAPSVSPAQGQSKSLIERLRALTWSSLISGIRRRLRVRRAEPQYTGELSKWLYDELSLAILLESRGFREPRRQDHRRSMIPDWERYALDESTYGSHAIEPSLYLEARKLS